MDDFIRVFTDFIVQAAPYAIVWRIGEYIASTLIGVITGGRGGRSGRLDL